MATSGDKKRMQTRDKPADLGGIVVASDTAITMKLAADLTGRSYDHIAELCRAGRIKTVKRPDSRRPMTTLAWVNAYFLGTDQPENITGEWGNSYGIR